MRKKYLPIGSVVKVDRIDKELMIIGYYSLEYKNSVKIYDYEAISYPEGMLLKNNVYSFNHNEIIDILFLGYEGENFNVLNNNLINQLNTDDASMKQPKSFINLKFDENGVVVYEELSNIKESPTIVDPINNPFVEKNITESESDIPLVNIDFDKIEEESIETIADKENINRNMKFSFDENGTVVEEITNPEKVENLEIPTYQFDENGIIIGIKNNDNVHTESNIKYNFDENGIVVDNSNLNSNDNEGEFEMPHYEFDENGIIINN